MMAKLEHLSGGGTFLWADAENSMMAGKLKMKLAEDGVHLKKAYLVER